MAKFQNQRNPELIAQYSEAISDRFRAAIVEYLQSDRQVAKKVRLR